MFLFGLSTIAWNIRRWQFLRSWQYLNLWVHVLVKPFLQPQQSHPDQRPSQEGNDAHTIVLVYHVLVSLAVNKSIIVKNQYIIEQYKRCICQSKDMKDVLHKDSQHLWWEMYLPLQRQASLCLWHLWCLYKDIKDAKDEPDIFLMSILALVNSISDRGKYIIVHTYPSQIHTVPYLP